MGPRVLIGAAFAVAAIVAIVAPGGRVRRRRRVAAVSDAPAVDHGPGRGGRWVGHDRARLPGLLALGQARRRDRGLQRRGRGRHARALPAGLQGLGRSLPADDDRPGDARRDRDQRVRRAADGHDADRDADHRDRGDRRARRSPSTSRSRTWWPTSRRDPGSVRWAGGSAGGTDQLLVGQLARGRGRRRAQDQVRRPLRRRRGERGDPVRLGRRRRVRPERVHRPGRGGQDAPARGLLPGRHPGRRAQARRRSRTRASTSS